MASSPHDKAHMTCAIASPSLNCTIALSLVYKQCVSSYTLENPTIYLFWVISDIIKPSGEEQACFHSQWSQGPSGSSEMGCHHLTLNLHHHLIPHCHPSCSSWPWSSSSSAFWTQSSGFNWARTEHNSTESEQHQTWIAEQETLPA